MMKSYCTSRKHGESSGKLLAGAQQHSLPMETWQLHSTAKETDRRYGTRELARKYANCMTYGSMHFPRTGNYSQQLTRRQQNVIPAVCLSARRRLESYFKKLMSAKGSGYVWELSLLTARTS